MKHKNKKNNMPQHKHVPSTNQNCIELNVNGMHCAACELVIEKKLSKFEGVKKVNAMLSQQKVKIWGDFNESERELAREMTKLIEEDGYTLSTERGKKQVNWDEFIIAAPIAVIIIFLFFLLQKLGIVNLFNPESINLPAVFMIGIVASLSSCMAVVGGLVLSISANYAKEESKSKARNAMIMFHASRVIGFFILGGVLGLMGAAFTSSKASENASSAAGYAPFIMSLLVAVVMAILGLNLLDIFDFTKKLQFKMPKSLSRTAINTENVQNKWAPLFLGIATFFLPCGFTQTTQSLAFRTSSFVQGGLTMLVFALGTLPMLGLISFASNKMVVKKEKSGAFFKVAGLIVLFFALVNFTGALAAAGVINPIFSFLLT